MTSADNLKVVLQAMQAHEALTQTVLAGCAGWASGTRKGPRSLKLGLLLQELTFLAADVVSGSGASGSGTWANGSSLRKDRASGLSHHCLSYQTEDTDTKPGSHSDGRLPTSRSVLEVNTGCSVGATVLGKEKTKGCTEKKDVSRYLRYR